MAELDAGHVGDRVERAGLHDAAGEAEIAKALGHGVVQ